ncbi:MAG: phosphonopyruvate decarboxylase [Chromatiales bacterium]|jgi:phosphonopyruvate decarboxylase|nr:phosphonopyruvate decarboxylase [Chromatiales bacterium]
MIEAREFVEAARAQEFATYAGVPCSFLTPFINYVIGDDTLGYLACANEGDAVATAAGAWIGGKPGVAMMQNSGLGNAVSPLTSLNYTFRIPILLICTQRGAPGVSDEPQHELMGAITQSMFDTIHVAHGAFPDQSADIETALKTASAHMDETRQPFALIMQKGACAPYPLSPQQILKRSRATAVGGSGHSHRTAARPTRHGALRTVVDRTGNGATVVIATTGFTGRELYSIDDRDNHLYIVGSMGCASSLGMGLALARPDLRVVVVDGDGAALMRMGNLAVVGARGPANFVHIILDNESHDSTGSQSTVAAHTDFAGIALACGYRRVVRAGELEELDNFLKTDEAGPALLHLKTQPGTIDNLPRPSIAPPDVLDRLRRHIGTG